jgi:3-isopropylmalate/(R)-2-methylmalate dehydratase small subunit
VEKFTVLRGVAAPLPVPNVNTDVLIRIERLNELDNDQLGPYCFEAWRYDATGAEVSDFVLNQPPYRNAVILIGGRNFGCGSSREGAVWALRGMGIRCLIAPSFGDIFFNNCFQNGVLPIVLPAATVDELAKEAAAVAAGPDRDFTIDLTTQTLTTPSGAQHPFPIDAPKRLALLQGLDEIAMTLAHTAEITAYQQRDRLLRPWIYLPGTKL